MGGGILLTPFFLWRGATVLQAFATSIACTIPIGLFGALGYLIRGWHTPHLPEHCLGFIYWPAFLAILPSSLVAATWSSRLAYQLPEKILRQFFAILIMMIGIGLIVDAWRIP